MRKYSTENGANILFGLDGHSERERERELESWFIDHTELIIFCNN